MGAVLLAVCSAIGGWWALAEPGSEVHLGLRGGLAALGALLLLGWWGAGSLGLQGERSVQWVRRLASVALVGWAAATIGAVAGGDFERVAVRNEVHLWSHYHYYLGSKYFAELGYTGLYEQTVAADRERRRPRIRAKVLRDLTTYDRVRIDAVGPVRSPAFTDARWADFKEDVAFFRKLPWKRVLIDRGYNPTPTGHVVYSVLSRIPLTEPNVARISLLDTALLLLAFGAAGWVFGPIRALVAAAWLALWFGNEHRLIGWPLQYDYVAALIGMACAFRRGWWGTAGALLAYAAMVRVFPGLLVGGLAVWAAGWWWVRGWVPRGVIRFGAAFAVAAVLLGGVGASTARGPGAWVEWSRNMALHTDDHRFGDRRVGLQHLFTYAEGDNEGWAYKRGRREVWEQRAPWWLLAAGVGGLLWAALAFRGGRRGDDPLTHLVLALWLVFLGVVVSRYYWSVACLVFLVGGKARDDVALAPIGAGLLAVIAAYYATASQTGSDFGRYWFANLWLLAWWTAVGVGLWWARPRPSGPRPGADERGLPDEVAAPAGAEVG